MELSDFKTSRFLKKEDIGEGVFVTIRSLSKEDVSPEGAEPEFKVCIHFDELAKPLVCNATNANVIAQITGKEKDIEKEWVGKQIVLYFDPNVSFGGKLTGGIRVRAPRLPAKPVSDLPF